MKWLISAEGLIPAVLVENQSHIMELALGIAELHSIKDFIDSV